MIRLIVMMILGCCCTDDVDREDEAPPELPTPPLNPSDRPERFRLDSYTPQKNAPEAAPEKTQKAPPEKTYPQDFGTTFQDKQLNAKIRKAMNQGWFSKDYDALSVQTNNGVVVISGDVGNEEDIQKLNEELKNLDGIQSLSLQINVKKP